MTGSDIVQYGRSAFGLVGRATRPIAALWRTASWPLEARAVVLDWPRCRFSRQQRALIPLACAIAFVSAHDLKASAGPQRGAAW